MTLKKVTASELRPGQSVIWMKTARGGYGYQFQIRASIVRLTGSKATIRLDEHNSRLRSVLIENLRI